MGDAVIPLKVIVLVPWLSPKLLPEIVTAVPACPCAGLRPRMPGVVMNGTPLLGTPFTMTTTLPGTA